MEKELAQIFYTCLSDLKEYLITQNREDKELNEILQVCIAKLIEGVYEENASKVSARITQILLKMENEEK